MVGRILLLGAESSGKTTLAIELASRYAAPLVPEYFRTYWDGKRHSRDAAGWTTEEFVHLAEAQIRLEDQLALVAERQGAPVLICDTGALSTSIWHRRYLGAYSPAVDVLARGRSYDLVLLCGEDVPFVQDGVRDGELVRTAMTAWHRERLADWSIPYKELTGSFASRRAEVAALIGAQRQ